MSALFRMRRALSLALLLMVASAVTALAATVGSAQAHRKTSTSSHRLRHTSSHAAVKHTYTHTRSRTTRRTSLREVRYTPRPTAEHATARKEASASDNANCYKGVTPAYAIGYRNGYEAGRTSGNATSFKGVTPAYSIGYMNGYDAGRAALHESASGGANSPGKAPANSAATEVASLRQPAFALQSAEPTADSTATRAARPLSPGEATELPFRLQAGDAREPATETEEDAAGSQAESAGTARELARESHAGALPEMASLDLPDSGMTTSLRGSLASLERQNTRLESEGLERILDEDDLSSRIAHGLLVPLPVSAGLTVNPEMIENHRYCRPWTERFLSDLARAHAAAFHRPIEVSSAVRTVEYQKRLMRINGNAAAAEGDIVSPHLTGATIDIAKHGMTRYELAWMRSRLLAMQQAGKIDVEEEFEQACFHITVYKTYTSSSPSHKSAQPAVREAVNRHLPPPTPAQSRPGSSLPSSIAAGTFTPTGR